MKNDRACPFCGHLQAEYTGKTTDRAHNQLEIYRCHTCGENHLLVNAASAAFTIPAMEMNR